MLVLTRKVGEKINIGNNIYVSVLEINKGNIKLGIDAPKDVAIFRQELYEKIEKENIKAATASAENLASFAKLLINEDDQKR